MNDGTFDGVFLPSTGMSERDSSRALNFARGSFASFLAPSKKKRESFLDLFWTRMLKSIISKKAKSNRYSSAFSAYDSE